MKYVYIDTVHHFSKIKIFHITFSTIIMEITCTCIKDDVGENLYFCSE